MVSFRNILFLVTAAVATVSEARSIGHKRYGRLHARHGYHNETLPHPVEGYPAEGYPSTGETGVEGYPAETITVPHGTGIQTIPTEVPQYGEETESPVITSCYTYYETKTVTYTLGNGHAVTTTFTQTNVVTETISPALETPVDHGVSTPVEEGPVVTVVPVPVGGDNDYDNGNETPEEPEYEWTSTSTTTVLHTVTRILPHPNEVVTDSPAGETPCVVATVTVTAPAQETVTVKETIKEYITVTATADAGPIETVSPIVEEPVDEPVEEPTPGYGDEEPVEEPIEEHTPGYGEEEPVEESPVEEYPVEESPVEETPVEHTPVPAHPPYGNYTGNYTFPTTTQEPQATLTVVPIPAY